MICTATNGRHLQESSVAHVAAVQVCLAARQSEDELHRARAVVGRHKCHLNTCSTALCWVTLPSRGTAITTSRGSAGSCHGSHRHSASSVLKSAEVSNMP